MSDTSKGLDGQEFRDGMSTLFEWRRVALYVCKCGADIDVFVAINKKLESGMRGACWHVEHDGKYLWEETIGFKGNTDADEAMAVMEEVDYELWQLSIKCGWLK